MDPVPIPSLAQLHPDLYEQISNTSDNHDYDHDEAPFSVENVTVTTFYLSDF